ncbi:MAG: asparagine synthase (glutamine-hydrolyzing) [Rhodospirillaceae bacterium]|nr:asparagine synthase (glutamine-hydrolyzing) [Rhodospirillaceae bacterium]
MCGIAGLVTRNGAAPSTVTLQKLAQALAHRGPDGHAVRVVASAGLVHTRLAIVDLAGGAQPLVASDNVALIANAEIYNDLDLRRTLSDAAYATGSDCESALHAYRRYGETFAAHLRGMYAIAVHDPAKEVMLLARDPFGIKPLYLADVADGLCFASEPQALMAAGLVPPRVNAAAAQELLALQFTNGLETAFAGITRVAPGETLVIEKGRVVRRHTVPALPPAGLLQLTEDEALAVFDAAWRDSIQVHRRADVPYGMFLSGGIDSSSVLAMMAAQEPRAVLAYTAAFPGTAAHDERAQAQSVAQAFGATHIEVEITPADFWARLPEIAACMDDPVADYAVIPSYLLAERAKKDVKVILSGEGGDELLAGYGRYRAGVRPWPFRKTPWRKSALFDAGVLRTKADWRAGMDAAEARVETAGYRGLQAVQALDIATWLPNDLLLKVDRCLMAHGIEGRVPFLDPAVAKAVFGLPDGLKLRQGLGKRLLRRWLGQALPGYPALARKKGFSVPVAEWIAEQAARLAPLVAAQPGVAELCEPEAVRGLFAHASAKHGTARWLLLFYALWHNRHILGRKAEGDVFAALTH